MGGLGRPSSGKQAACRNPEGASPRDPASATKAGGRQHALVLPETGQELALSKSTVQRILAQAQLKPHRLERYMASNDPDFEPKAADIIGLYLNPPQHTAVFCLDEKTAIQALHRLDPVLPLSPGRAERHGFEYYRHGTLSLYAALDVKTGKVEGKTAKRHTSAEFIAFLAQLLSKTRWAKEIHLREEFAMIATERPDVDRCSAAQG